MTSRSSSIAALSGQVLELFCGRCGRSLGAYEVQERDGFVQLYDQAGSRRALRSAGRRPGVRGPRTGRRRVLVEHHAGETYLRWRCGCGADVRRRADRLGRLEAIFTAGRFTLTL
ncbi:MAG: hypothetical protein ACE14W_07130 [Candidatus Velamenicoccus archaeovorus]